MCRVRFVGGDGGDYPRHWFGVSPSLVPFKASQGGILYVLCAHAVVMMSLPLVHPCTAEGTAEPAAPPTTSLDSAKFHFRVRRISKFFSLAKTFPRSPKIVP